MTEGREGRSTALDRHETDPAPPRPAPTDVAPVAPRARLPRLAVAAWAGGRVAAPTGRKGKKMRRRTRKIAAALAAILVTSTFGGTAALADPSFYEASPHVSNAGLIDAGSQTFDWRLAIGQPESTEGNSITARTLEDAILTGGLSSDDMEMPDMMLAGISGDQMALAAAQDDDASPGVGPVAGSASDLAQTGADTIGETAGDGSDITGSVGEGPVTDATVDELTEDAAEENPEDFASPALGGDPEPIVEEYAAASPPEEGPPSEESAPVGPEMASADTGDAPAAPVPEEEATDTAPTVGAETDAEPAQSDELAYTTIPDDGASEDAEPAAEETELAPAEYDAGDAGDAPTSTPAPAPEEQNSPPGFAWAEMGRPDDGYSYTSETSGGAEAPREAAPQEAMAEEHAEALSSAPAEPVYSYGHEEEAKYYVEDAPLDHSSAEESSAEHGASQQEEAHRSGADASGEGAQEYPEPTIPEEAPPILEEDAGPGFLGQAGTEPDPVQDLGQAPGQEDEVPADAQNQDGGGSSPEEGDQTFSGGGSSAAPAQAGRPDNAPSQEDGPQEGPQVDAPVDPGDPAQEGVGGAHNRPQDAPQHTEQEDPQDGPRGRTAPDEVTGGESDASDEFRAAPKDGAARTPPIWDRQGVPEEGRPRDRAAEVRATHEPDPAADEQAREERRAERIVQEQAERREVRRAERQVEFEAQRRAERQEFREDRRAERLARQHAERRAERQAERRAVRKAERQPARELATQEAAAAEAAKRAALRQQRRAERAAQEAPVDVEGFAGTGARRSLPSTRRWDAPAVEPQLPAGRKAAREWSQPVEPVSVQPAYQKPVPVRFVGAGDHAAGGAAETFKGVMR